MPPVFFPIHPILAFLLTQVLTASMVDNHPHEYPKTQKKAPVFAEALVRSICPFDRISCLSCRHRCVRVPPRSCCSHLFSR